MHITALLRPVLPAVLFAPLFWTSPAPANTPENLHRTSNGLEMEMQAERRVVTSSSEGAQVEFVAADQLHIGDEIFYTVRVRNATNVAIDDVVVIRPVPRNTEYVADSAVGPAAKIGFSIDGGATFATRAELEVATMPGVMRRATTGDYTHLRWQLRHPLAAGATALLRFRGVFK